MAEYIKRASAMTICEKHSQHCFEQNDSHGQHIADGVFDDVVNIPTADVVEVRHGEWEIKSRIHQMFDDVDEELYIECPFCKREFWIPYEFDDAKILEYAREHYPYCNCGAKMDGKDGADEQMDQR